MKCMMSKKLILIFYLFLSRGGIRRLDKVLRDSLLSLLQNDIFSNKCVSYKHITKNTDEGVVYRCMSPQNGR